MIEKIISGGQTGADRAALDVAIKLGISHGGWIPKGRKTEKGRLPDRYMVRETNSTDYDQRTELNVAGPRESEDPAIYQAVENILSGLLYPPPERITSG